MSNSIDFKALVSGVVNSMIADKCVDAFINATEDQRIEIALAYADAQLKKITQFTSIYMINAEARSAFRLQLVNLLTA